MGGILSMSSLACCAGTAACNAVCSVFGSCQNSTMSKLMYELTTGYSDTS